MNYPTIILITLAVFTLVRIVVMAQLGQEISFDSVTDFGPFEEIAKNLGLFCLLAGVSWSFSSAIFFLRSNPIEGTVLSVELIGRSPVYSRNASRGYYVATIMYEAAGKAYTFRGYPYPWQYERRIGTHPRVYYVRSHPTRANTLNDLLEIPSSFLLVGVILYLLGRRAQSESEI